MNPTTNTTAADAVSLINFLESVFADITVSNRQNKTKKYSTFFVERKQESEVQRT